MIHFRLSTETASTVVSQRRTGNPPLPGILSSAGAGDDCRDDVEALMDRFRSTFWGAKRSNSTSFTSKIGKDRLEGLLSVKFYEDLSTLPSSVLTSPGFWRYLAAWEMFDFIEWRDGVGCSLSSYGAASATPTMDCVPLRIFVRGQVGTSAAPDDPMSIAGIAGTDVWRSHVLRVRTAREPAVARALLQAWDRGDAKTDVVRDVAKRLKRLRSNVVFELLDHAQAETLVAAEIESAKASLAGESK